MPATSRRTLGLVAGAATAAIVIFLLPDAVRPVARPGPAVPADSPPATMRNGSSITCNIKYSATTNRSKIRMTIYSMHMYCFNDTIKRSFIIF